MFRDLGCVGRRARLIGRRFAVGLLGVIAALATFDAAAAQFGPPEPIQPSGPITTARPTYEWSPVAGATWYQLWVNDSTGTVINRWYTAAQVNAASGICSTKPAEAIAAVGGATWWVRAWNAAQGSGPWSVGLSFDVPLTAAVPLSPSGTATVASPTYRWAEVPGSTWYQLWVNDSTGTVINRWYTAAQVNADSGECSITPAEAIAAGNATWWIRTWNPHWGPGPWSVARQFSVAEAPLSWADILEFDPDPSIVTDPVLRASIASTGLPWRVRDIASGIEMLLVPPGSFTMGSDWGGEFNEQPAHEVTLTSPYYLGRFEVTQAQWYWVTGYNPSWFQGFPDSGLRPVEAVSWNDVLLFRQLTGLRLPTEAEWEFACRAGTSTQYNNGSDDLASIDPWAWTIGAGGEQPQPVGLKLANRLGFHDMHANVFEWCEDFYSSSYYDESPSVDPPGPSFGNDLTAFNRVLRGGGYGFWSYSFEPYRSSARDGRYPFFGYDLGLAFTSFGFRVARNP